MSSVKFVPLFVLVCVPLAAQTDRATLTGTVLDQSQSVVPVAAVSVHAVATGSEYATLTNSVGAYTFALYRCCR